MFLQIKRLIFRNKNLVIEDWYENGYRFFFKRKGLLFLIVGSFLLLGIILFLKMPYGKLPEFRQTESMLNLDWNENINVRENQKRIDNLLKNIGQIEVYFSQIGEQQYLLNKENSKSFSEAEIYIKTDSPENLKVVLAHLTNQLHEYPRAVFQFNPPKNILEYIFGNDKNQLTAKVFSKTNREVPPENSIPEIESVLGFQIQDQMSIEETAYIDVIHENVLLYDIDYIQLMSEIKSAFNQNLVDNLKTAQKFIPIKIYYGQDDVEKILSKLFVKSRSGQLIPMKSLVRIYNAQKYKSIFADRNGEYLGINLITDNNEQAIIQSTTAGFGATNDFNVRFSGNYFDLKVLASELSTVILVSLFLLYFIMAAQFESLWQPLDNLTRNTHRFRSSFVVALVIRRHYKYHGSYRHCGDEWCCHQ